MQASMFPLPPHLVFHITSLRSLSLMKLLEAPPLGAAAWRSADGAREGLRMGFVVHKLPGLMSGLLRDLLSSPLSRSEYSYRQAPTLVLFAWDVAAPSRTANAWAKDESAKDENEDAREAAAFPKDLLGVDERVGLGGLRAVEAAREVNAHRVHVLVCCLSSPVHSCFTRTNARKHARARTHASTYARMHARIHTRIHARIHARAPDALACPPFRHMQCVLSHAPCLQRSISWDGFLRDDRRLP